MKAFDAMKAAIDTMNEWVSVSMAGSRSQKNVASRPLQHRASEIAKSEDGLSDALQRDDRQMLSSVAMLDAQLDHRARPSTNERVRSSTRRATRPPRPAKCLAPGRIINRELSRRARGS